MIDFYEIKLDHSTIKIPVPLFKDYKCFKAEFLDIIMHYIVKERNLFQPFLEGPYEYKDVAIKEGGIVFDCGANYGMFSSLASSRNCEVYAFEPTLSLNDYYLSKIKQLNSSVNIVNKAVSNCIGKTLFKVNENKNSCNCLYEVNNNTQKEFSPDLAICYYHRLDDLKVLKKLILTANPNYEIETSWKKIYARVPKK